MAHSAHMLVTEIGQTIVKPTRHTLDAMFTERAVDFMHETDSLVPTNHPPDMDKVLLEYERADTEYSHGEVDYGDAIQKHCMMVHFEDDWYRALPECFKYKDGTRTRNVNFYVERGEDIMKQSGLEEWEIEELNEPFIDRVAGLKYLEDWFSSAEDPQSVIKFVYSVC